MPRAIPWLYIFSAKKNHDFDIDMASIKVIVNRDVATKQGEKRLVNKIVVTSIQQVNPMKGPIRAWKFASRWNR
jgi:hypothetical protein